MQASEFKPVISTFNPFFSEHHWDDAQKTERAHIGAHRILLISQAGCKRHHTVLLQVMSPGCIVPNDSFWINEACGLLYAVYHDQAVYRLFRGDFEREFRQKIAEYGVNQAFNFPIGTRNFVCEIKYDPQRGANLRIELVQYVFEEKLYAPPQNNPVHDDGWLGRRQAPDIRQ